MMNEHDIQRIAEAVAEKTKATHVCVFDEEQIKTATRFFNALGPEEWPKFQAVMDFGANIILARKTASVTAIGAIVTGICALFVWGFKSWLAKGDSP